MIGVETITLPSGETLTFRFDFNARRRIAGYLGESLVLEDEYTEEKLAELMDKSAEKLSNVDVFTVYENFVYILRGGLESGMGKDYGADFIDGLIAEHEEALAPVVRAAREGFDLSEKKARLFQKFVQADPKA